MAASVLVTVTVTVTVTAVWHARPVTAAVVAGYGSSTDGLDAGPLAIPSGGAVGPASGTFSISGSAAGLYPGETLPLRLYVTNPFAFPIVVKSVAVSVGRPSPRCDAANVTVTTFIGDLSIGARSSAPLVLEIAMRHAAPDACEGALFPLRYGGTATR